MSEPKNTIDAHNSLTLLRFHYSTRVQYSLCYNDLAGYKWIHDCSHGRPCTADIHPYPQTHPIFLYTCSIYFPFSLSPMLSLAPWFSKHKYKVSKIKCPIRERDRPMKHIKKINRHDPVLIKEPQF